MSVHQTDGRCERNAVLCVIADLRSVGKGLAASAAIRRMSASAVSENEAEAGSMPRFRQNSAALTPLLAARYPESRRQNSPRVIAVW